jgi:hypothetical protein
MIHLDSFMKIINYFLNDEVYVDQLISSVSPFILIHMNVHVMDLRIYHHHQWIKVTDRNSKRNGCPIWVFLHFLRECKTDRTKVSCIACDIHLCSKQLTRWY